MTCSPCPRCKPRLPGMEAHFGPMFAEKTHHAYAAARRQGHATPELELVCFRPEHDDRSDGIHSRVSGVTIPAETLPGTPQGVIATLTPFLQKPAILFTDEMHFIGVSEAHPKLSPEEARAIMDLYLKLMLAGCAIFLAGLDNDHANRSFPFNSLVQQNAYVRKVYHTAICQICRAIDARHTRLLTDGIPASPELSSYIVEKKGEKKPAGPKLTYEPRCDTCYAQML